MPTIQDILKFHFAPTTFQQSVQKIIPVTLSSLIGHRIDKLQKITEDIGASDFSALPINSIPQVFRKFKDFIFYQEESFSKKELRTLCYSFSYSEKNIPCILENEFELRLALKEINKFWRDSYFIGLIDCLLRNWETNHQKSLEELEQFIVKKLDNYTGNRGTLISFKDNKRYFSTKNGDLILGDTIAKLNRPIQEATKIFGVPESWFAYPYFSKVIVTYYERNKSKIADEIGGLIEVLEKHNSSVTNKRLISKMIIQANHPQFVTLQDKIKKIAFAQIGDPSNLPYWAPFKNATEVEKNELSEARGILDEWIAKQFIDIFFRVCLNDERRKKFWLHIASKNKLSFKVYGPNRTKRLLQQDERISQYLDARFETVSSTRDVSAFILYIDDYMLIEFSDAGYAFYAYKLSGASKPNLNYELNSVDELRNSNMPMLVYRTGHSIKSTNIEGRLGHNDGDVLWERVFEYWLKNVAGINV